MALIFKEKISIGKKDEHWGIKRLDLTDCKMLELSRSSGDRKTTLKAEKKKI